MIALYDHIQELKAELGSCIMTRRERASMKCELAQATAEHNATERALDDMFEAPDGDGR
jgi:hypothetical protein